MPANHSPSPLAVAREHRKIFSASQSLRLQGFQGLTSDNNAAEELAELPLPTASRLLHFYEVKRESPHEFRLPQAYKKLCPGSFYACLDSSGGEHKPCMLLFPESSYERLMHTQSRLQGLHGKAFSFVETFTQITPAGSLLSIPEGPLRDALTKGHTATEPLIIAGEMHALSVWHASVFKKFMEHGREINRKRSHLLIDQSANLNCPPHHHGPPA